MDYFIKVTLIDAKTGQELDALTSRTDGTPADIVQAVKMLVPDLKLPTPTKP